MKGKVPFGKASLWGAALLVAISLLAATGTGYLWGARVASVKAQRPSVQRDLRAEPLGGHRHDSTLPARANGDDGPARPSQDAPVSALKQEEDEPPPLSPEEARARYVRGIAASGPDSRGLIADARRVGEDWSKVVREKDLDASFDEWRCHRAGCFVTARHASAESVDRVTDEITHSRGFLHWNGEKMRTGPVQMSDGKTEVAWILMAPAEGEAALGPGLESDSTARAMQ